VSNIIFHSQSGDKYLRLSNSATPVLINILLLSTSDIATNNWQRRLAVFWAEQDQSIRGVGMVSFHLDEIGWVPDEFKTQKEFVLRAIELASSRYRWESLPHPLVFWFEWVTEILPELRDLILAFEAEHIDPSNSWLFDDGDYFPEKCDVHNVYMWQYGCHICRR